jgi:Prealbumin-like fold domain
MTFPKLAVTLILTTLIFAISTLVITSSQTVLSSSNQTQGKLIVINKVVNEGGGNKKASDFIINVHGNDPSPSSFSGSSSGIPVMLHMGMYSVTEKGPPGYNSTLSDDCSGGMMSAETKKCIITNIYSK